MEEVSHPFGTLAHQLRVHKTTDTMSSCLGNAQRFTHGGTGRKESEKKLDVLRERGQPSVLYACSSTKNLEDDRHHVKSFGQRTAFHPWWQKGGLGDEATAGAYW